MSIRKIYVFLIISFISGCATPPEVKQLSIKQMEYFDAAISAVSIQSEALIIAAERITTEAKERIDAEDMAAKVQLTNLIEKGGLTRDQSEDVSKRITNQSLLAISAKNKLDNDLESIRKKTEELNRYLVKMKEVHIALDSYIQSEKAGEKVTNDVLNQPSVNALLDRVNELAPKIQNEVSILANLLNVK